MSEEKKKIVKEAIETMKQLDLVGLTAVKISIDALKARQDLEQIQKTAWS